MIESYPVPAVPEDVVRQQWVVYAATIRRLLHAGVLGRPALELVRTDLRIGDWRAASVPASHRSQHVELLDEITAAYAGHLDPAMRSYFEGCGDLLPTAPDDLSGIDTLDEPPC